MSVGRWQRVEELFARAADLPATARDDLLARECGDDDVLRAEVRSLLIHGADAAGALRGTVAAAAGAIASDEPGARSCARSAAAPRSSSTPRSAPTAR